MGLLIHGYSRRRKRHPLHIAWDNMLRRCENPNDPRFRLYGARGIKVCRRWKTFTNFLEDMLPGYRRGLSIERVDNDKGYFKNNCKWETHRVQCLNRTNSRKINFNGRNLNLCTWSRIINLPSSTLRNRIGILGWTVERAFTTPRRKRKTK